MKIFFIKNKWFFVFLIPVILVSGYLISNQIKYPEVRWDWDEIDATKLDFSDRIPMGRCYCCSSSRRIFNK